MGLNIAFLFIIVLGSFFPPLPSTFGLATLDKAIIGQQDKSIFEKALSRSVGENGFNDKAVLLTVCTIYNRLDSTTYGDIDHVLKAYYAPDKLYSHKLFLYVKKNLINCPQKIKYALSYTDIIFLGFAVKDAVLIVGNSETCESEGDKRQRKQCAYFYDNWGN